MKGLVVGLLLGGLAVAAWLGRDELAHKLTGAVDGAVNSTVRGAAPPGLPNAGPGPAAAGGLHKCLQGSQVLYTDAPCPQGSRTQAVAGAVTVVPGMPSGPPAPAASGLPNVRQVLAPPDAVDLKAERIDAVIGK